MNSGVYITDIVSLELPDADVGEPRERFMRYYQDLHHLYNNELSHETFSQGGKYAFSTIGEHVLNQFQEDDFLKELDILIPVYWAHEFDPDYSNCGAYLQEKFQLNCDLLDIYDQGTLAGFTGLHILQRYLLSDQYNKGMMIALEQTTIPRRLMDHHVMPAVNSGCALIMQSADDVREIQSVNNLVFKLIDSTIFDSAKLHLSMRSSLNVILDFLAKNSLDKSSVSIVTKRGSVIWKQIQNNIYCNNGNKASEHYFYHHMSSQPSILSVLTHLEKIIHNEMECKSNYIMIIDEDIESLNVGILLLEMIKFHNF